MTTLIERQDSRAPVTDDALGAIRARFPALDRRHHGLPIAYFDGPGGTQVPREVVEAMRDYMLHHNANTHWNYPTSAETDALIQQARVAGGHFLNASPDEISFGNNMTTITFHLARALGRLWGRGDEVVVTELDHHANVAPWRDVAGERKLGVRTVPMKTADGTLDWDALRGALNRRTRLVAIGAASNALGTINDVAQAVALAHEAGALAFVDAVHYAAHEVTDVVAWGCDALVCSAYKFYGPHAGLAFVKRDLLESLPISRLAPAPNESPERAETGTQNHEGIVGAGAAIGFLASLGRGTDARSRLVDALSGIRHRSDRLFARLWTGLRTIDRVTVFGQPPEARRTPTIAFVVRGVPSADVARRLADRAVFVSHGDFYATTVVERLGYGDEGIVRAGCACYTTADEIDRLIAGVREIAST
jgi:cysteine desulfurase family protein (TIGR01976 family)